MWLLRKQRLEPRLLLRRCEDAGPGTHLLEAIKAEQHPETRILQAPCRVEKASNGSPKGRFEWESPRNQVDDDQFYGPELVRTLLRASMAAPGRAIGAATQQPSMIFALSFNFSMGSWLFSPIFL